MQNFPSRRSSLLAFLLLISALVTSAGRADARFIDHADKTIDRFIAVFSRDVARGTERSVAREVAARNNGRVIDVYDAGGVKAFLLRIPDTAIPGVLHDPRIELVERDSRGYL